MLGAMEWIRRLICLALSPCNALADTHPPLPATGPTPKVLIACKMLAMCGTEVTRNIRAKIDIVLGSSTDQCPNDPNKNTPGVCGCGIPDTDSDNDGIPDCHDQCPQDPRKSQPGICGCGRSEDSCRSSTPSEDSSPTPSQCSFTMSRKSNAIYYWGQDDQEGPLRNLCDDSSMDIVTIAFARYISTGSNIALDLGGHCWSTFPDDPTTLKCTDIEQDIQYCHSKGKQVFLTVASGSYSSSNVAQTWAQTVWNSFFSGGTGSKRPFGAASFDGLILDTTGGNPSYHSAFLTSFKSSVSRTSTPTGLQRALIGVSVAGCEFGDDFAGPGSDSGMVKAASNPVHLTGILKILFVPGPHGQAQVPTPTQRFHASFSATDVTQLGNTVADLFALSNIGGVAVWDYIANQPASDSAVTHLRSLDSSRQQC
ncbi:glycoside hydrolase family 18 protein [Pelomyxa schiedti]|nr:glycoside hydrolase family 18 protein [Pelomyxa schiedti]